MRFLVDENLPGIIAELANQLGIPAVWVRDEMRSAPDVEILRRLKTTDETLVTVTYGSPTTCSSKSLPANRSTA